MIRRFNCGCFLLLSALCASVSQAGWEARNEGLTSLPIIEIAIDPLDPDTLYARTMYKGIWKSDNGGESWIDVSDGRFRSSPGFRSRVQSEGILIHPAKPGRLVAVGSMNLQARSGLYLSVNGGADWELIGADEMSSPARGIVCLAQDPKDPDHLYAGAESDYYNSGIRESSDGGDTWTSVSREHKTTFMPLVLDLIDPRWMYSFSAGQSQIYSRDGGSTWQRIERRLGLPPAYGNFIAANPLKQGGVWFNRNNRTFYSLDGMASWVDRSDAFDANRVTEVSFAPSDPQIGYALTDAAIYRTTDNGDSWTIANVNLIAPRCIAIHPSDPHTLYVGTCCSGVFKSTDGANSFLEANAGLPTNLGYQFDALAVHPKEMGVAYVHLNQGGLYKSSDYGKSWELLSVLPCETVDDLAVLPWNTGVLLAAGRDPWYASNGPYGASVFRSKDGGRSWDIVLTSGEGVRFPFLSLDATNHRIWTSDWNPVDKSPSLFCSTTDGVRWDKMSSPLVTKRELISDLAVDPLDSQHLLMASRPVVLNHGGSGWIKQSRDGGRTWTESRNGLDLHGWYTRDGWWEHFRDPAILTAELRELSNQTCDSQLTLAECTIDEGTVLTRYSIRDPAPGDMGDPWIGLALHLPTKECHWSEGLLFSMPFNRNDIIVKSAGVACATLSYERRYSAPDELGVHVTGNSYDIIYNGEVIANWIDEANAWNDGYFALVNCHTKVYYSEVLVDTPNVEYHSDFSLGPFRSGGFVKEVAFSPVAEGVVYAMSNSGLYRSSDNAESWEQISYPGRSGDVYLDMLVTSSPEDFVLTSIQPERANYWGDVVQAEKGYYSKDSVGGILWDRKTQLAEDVGKGGILYCIDPDEGFMVYHGEIPIPPEVPEGLLKLR